MSAPAAAAAPSGKSWAVTTAVLIALSPLALMYDSGLAASEPATDGGNAVSGTLFRAVKRATYSGPRLFSSWKQSRAAKSDVLAAVASLAQLPSSGCSSWAVVTSIYPPTKTVLQLLSMPGWCVVVAGDLKSPTSYNATGAAGSAIYLSPDAQRRLPFSSLARLRWNHFGRKNVGYLFAIAHGARWVYDTDDDNELLALGGGGVPLPRAGDRVSEVHTRHPLYNLYPQMSGNAAAWPRGFPLDAIHDNATKNAKITPAAWPAEQASRRPARAARASSLARGVTSPRPNAPQCAPMHASQPPAAPPGVIRQPRAAPPPAADQAAHPPSPPPGRRWGSSRASPTTTRTSTASTASPTASHSTSFATALAGPSRCRRAR